MATVAARSRDLAGLLRAVRWQAGAHALAGLPRFFGATATSDERVDFGQRDVPRSEKQGMVNQVFSSVASRYDLMNDLMSLGVHRLWKDHFVARLDPAPGVAHLDVAGGTGDIAFRVLRRLRERQGAAVGARIDGHVTVLDINAEMVAAGRARADAEQLSGPHLAWIVGSAEALPLPDASMDSYTVAFGIRNVPDRAAALREAHRVLRPGGHFLCLEFTPIRDKALKALYRPAKTIVPLIGRVVADDAESYAYLMESIDRFPDPETWADQIQEAGFRCVDFDLSPEKVTATHSGFKL